MRFNEFSSTSLLLLAATAAAHGFDEQSATPEMVSTLTTLTQQTTRTQSELSSMNCDNVDSGMVTLFEQLRSLGFAAARNTAAPAALQSRSDKLYTWVGSAAAHAKMAAHDLNADGHAINARALPASLTSAQQSQVCPAALTFFQAAINMAQQARATRDTLAPCFASAQNSLAQGLTTAGTGIDNFGDLLTALAPQCASEIAAAETIFQNSLSATIASLGGNDLPTGTAVVSGCIPTATSSSAFSLSALTSLLGLGDNSEPQASGVACTEVVPVTDNSLTGAGSASQGNGLLGLNLGGVNQKRDYTPPTPYEAETSTEPAYYAKPTEQPYVAPVEYPYVAPAPAPYHTKSVVPAPYYAKPTETPYVAPVPSPYEKPTTVETPYYVKPVETPYVVPSPYEKPTTVETPYYVKPVETPYYVKPTETPYVVPSPYEKPTTVETPYYVKPTETPYYVKPTETPYVAPVATSEYAVPTEPTSYDASGLASYYDPENVEDTVVVPSAAPSAGVEQHGNILESLLGSGGNLKRDYYSNTVVVAPTPYYGAPVPSSSVLVIAEPTATVVPVSSDDDFVNEVLQALDFNGNDGGNIFKRWYSDPVTFATSYGIPAPSTSVLVIAEPTASAVPAVENNGLLSGLLGGLGGGNLAKRYTESPVADPTQYYYAEPTASTEVLVIAEPTASAVPAVENNGLLSGLLGGLGGGNLIKRYSESPVVDPTDYYYSEPTASTEVLVIAEPTASAVPAVENNGLLSGLLSGIGGGNLAKRYTESPVADPTQYYYADPTASSSVLVIAQPTATGVVTATPENVENNGLLSGLLGGLGGNAGGLVKRGIIDPFEVINEVPVDQPNAHQGNGGLLGLAIGGVNGANKNAERAEPSSNQGNGGLLGLALGGVNGASGDGASGNNIERSVPGQGNGLLGVNFGGNSPESSEEDGFGAASDSNAAQGNGIIGLNFAGNSPESDGQGSFQASPEAAAPKQGNGLLGLNFAGSSAQNDNQF